MAWMLARLEQSPYAGFPERELAERFPDEFGQASRERLVRRVAGPPAPGSVGSYPHRSGRAYVVVPVLGGGYEAFDDEDPEADPILVSRGDLVQWTIDLDALARKFQEDNAFTGKPESLSDRLHFIGERDEEGGRTAFILALLSHEDIALEKLLALPALLPRVYRRTFVLCPSFQPSPTLRRRLQDLGLELAPLQFQAPDSFALAEVQGQAAVDLEFQYWDSYRSVRWRGQMLQLAPLQAQVVSILHQAARTGAPGLGWRAISQRLSSSASSMRDIFKKSDPRSALVVYDGRSRRYRLDL